MIKVVNKNEFLVIEIVKYSFHWNRQLNNNFIFICIYLSNHVIKAYHQGSSRSHTRTFVSSLSLQASLSTQDRYYQWYLDNAPQVESRNSYELKKGECLPD
jgi:hypothetical protein